MEKLIELLREYNRNKEGYRLALIEYMTVNGDKFEVGMEDKVKDMYKYRLNIISKEFGFIKWLVENDKIDIYPCPEEFRLQIKLDNGNYGNLGGEDRIIMLLSTSDTPIEDLISLLK